jgi:hypothetical protein
MPETTTTTTFVPRTTIKHEDDVCQTFAAWGSCKDDAHLRPFMNFHCVGTCYKADQPLGSDNGAERTDNFVITDSNGNASDTSEYLAFVNPLKRVSIDSTIVVIRDQYKTLYDPLKLRITFEQPAPERQTYAMYTVRIRKHVVEEEPEARMVESAKKVFCLLILYY